MDSNKTKVIFRKFPDGEVIALFPELPATVGGEDCMSYVHNGQHGAACPYGYTTTTKQASADEYASLFAELELVGYSLLVKKSVRGIHHDRRRAGSLLPA